MEANLAKTTTNHPTPITRSSAGLRDAIFDEIDAIRDGTGNPTRANAVAKLAATVVETVRMELEVQKYASASAGKVKTAEAVNGLPQPLALGV
jgi:hypothetical protein